MTRFDKPVAKVPRILCLDPGLRLGWVVVVPGYPLEDAPRGTWELRMRTDEGAGMRWIRLAKLLGQYEPTAIFYETTAYMAKYQDAVMVYSKIIGVIEAFCAQHGVPYAGLNVMTMRKALFGKGNLKKAEVPGAIRAKYGIEESRPDVADALVVAAYVLQEGLVCSSNS